MAASPILGVYLALITVNCIILGRAEAFANKNPVLASALDGLGMGVGFTAALFVMGAIREILGAGTFYGISIPFLSENPMLIFILPPGGFFTYGLLMAAVNRLAEKKGKPRAELRGCEACPMARNCALQNSGKEVSAS